MLYRVNKHAIVHILMKQAINVLDNHKIVSGRLCVKIKYFSLKKYLLLVLKYIDSLAMEASCE